MIKCPNCQGEMEFDSKTGMINCHYCKNSYDPEVLKQEVKVSTERKETDTYEGKNYTCSQCGANIMTFDETAVTFCSYCGSQAMIEDKLLKVNNPHYIIPFSITKEECINNYKKEISRNLFIPKYMKSDQTIDKFRSIYMPYCVYRIEKKSKETAHGSLYSHRLGNYKIYNKYRIDYDTDIVYDGISFDLLSKFYDKYSQAIPYNFKEAKPFNPNYLIGHYADALDVSGSTYLNQATDIISEDSKRRLRQYGEFAKYGCSYHTLDFGAIERKTALFPVYFLAIQNKNNKLINYAVVNGQTGKVVMDTPVSFLKYIIGSLIIAIIIFFLINSNIVLTPGKVALFSIGAGLLSLFISSKQIKKINIIENKLDDEGYIAANGDQKIVLVDKFKYTYKEIIAIILPILPLFLGLANDTYYYGASIISLILVVLSFKDIIEEYNILASNRLPQLEKRGGDESE